MKLHIEFLEPKLPLPNPKYFIPFFIAFLLLFMLIWWNWAKAEIPFTDINCIRACIGEASSQGYQGLLAVAVGIRNRGTLQGVYGLNARHIDREPKWVWDLARKAWQESKYNRIHSATHWESIDFKKPKWAYKMKEVYRYKEHIFYEEKNQD